MLSLKRVNRAIQEMGGKEELVKGKGYFYFVNVGANNAPSSGVYVYNLNQLTLDQWLRELEHKREELQ